MEQEIQQVEEIVEFEEDVEIIPEVSETDLARNNEMVVDADFIEEIPEPEIELEEVEEVSLLFYTLPRKILLCPINWGTQWKMEIGSNE